RVRQHLRRRAEPHPADHGQPAPPRDGPRVPRLVARASRRPNETHDPPARPHVRRPIHDGAAEMNEISPPRATRAISPSSAPRAIFAAPGPAIFAAAVVIVAAGLWVFEPGRAAAPPRVLEVRVGADRDGTAFAVGGGRVLTAAHVLRDGAPVFVAGRVAR